MKISGTSDVYGAVRRIVTLFLCLFIVATLFLSPWTSVDALSGAKAGTASTARPQTKPAAVASATKTKLASITGAENQVYTSDGRLFVTGDNGIFEIPTGASSNATSLTREPKQSCAFGGIVEVSGTLYTNCSGNGTSHIYAAKLSATPIFTPIYTFKNTILANGLTADSSGRLYVASTFFGQILRLTPSVTNPFTFTRTEVWLNGTGLATNGIKFAGGSIYWTDGPFLKRVAIKADGTPGLQKTIISGLVFFDDLTVTNDGILVADYIGNVIRSYDLSGHSTGTLHVSLSGPTSVAPAHAPFPAGSFIVTERAGNQVLLVTP